MPQPPGEGDGDGAIDATVRVTGGKAADAGRVGDHRAAVPGYDHAPALALDVVEPATSQRE
eukprot:2898634-Alexandrium_andersonii.AAC.1